MSFQMKLQGIEKEFSKIFQAQKLSIAAGNRKQVTAMVAELRAATPIDTGFARDSWETVNTQNSINVENTAEYIQHLNEGSSTQAPARFIESVALKYGVPAGTVVEIKGS